MSRYGDETVLNNIRELRAERGWSTRDLADRMGTHFTTIARIERSTKPLSADWTRQFAAAFDVAPAAIVGGTVASGSPALNQVPIIGMVAAGQWREAIQEPEGLLASPYAGTNAFALAVAGDSMSKVTPDGSYVIVDPDRPELHDGDLYVVMNSDSETTFKQYRANPARLEPMSLNDEHQAIMLGRSPFEVVGRVVGIYRPM